MANSVQLLLQLPTGTELGKNIFLLVGSRYGGIQKIRFLGISEVGENQKTIDIERRKRKKSVKTMAGFAFMEAAWTKKNNKIGSGVYTDHCYYRLSLFFLPFFSLSTTIAFDPLQGNSGGWTFVSLILLA